MAGSKYCESTCRRNRGAFQRGKPGTLAGTNTLPTGTELNRGAKSSAILTTEGINSSVESGLGIGFVPSLALEKALKLGTVNAIQLENGPIRRPLSPALLSGPDPKGPIGTMAELVREHGANHRNSRSKMHADDEPTGVVVMSGRNSTGHKKAAL